MLTICKQIKSFSTHRIDKVYLLETRVESRIISWGLIKPYVCHKSLYAI